MAMHMAARGRLCALLARAASRTEGGACAARPEPACPPCRAAPQPACRARTAAVRRARRVLCCPPPAGARPPCAPPPPSCSLTCRDLNDKENQPPCEVPPLSESSGCSELDPVAQRLQLAKRARRAQYERDAAQRAARPRHTPAPPPAPYRLAGERECALATDGSHYAIRGPVCADPAPRCGPGRTPPAPRCVELAPDDGCRIKAEAHLDPCAHLPRVMIDIDRSATNTAAPPSPTPTATASQGGGRAATRAGDTSWCANPPPAAAAPPRCRRPTIVERLRARSASRIPNGTSQNERHLHTSVILTSRDAKSSMENMLNLKGQLKEAGVGRVVTDVDRAQQVRPPGGRLELCVPAGTERVAVVVSLEAAPRAAAGGSCAGAAAAAASVTSTTSTCAQQTSSPCNSFASVSEQRDTWLSIKKIQEKLSGGRCEGGSTKLQTGLASKGAASTQLSPRCKESTSTATKETTDSSSTSSFLANTVV